MLRFGCDNAISEARLKKIRGSKYLAKISSNKMNDCFVNAITHHFVHTKCKNPLDSSEEPYKKFIATLNLGNIEEGTPVTISDIKAFVKTNPALNLKINLLGLHGESDIYALGKNCAF